MAGPIGAYYRELAIDRHPPPLALEQPHRVDSAMCDVVEETLPRIVSFRFGAPPSRGCCGGLR